MPFDPLPNDEAPDTCHDPPTRRTLEAFFGDEPVSSDEPATPVLPPVHASFDDDLEEDLPPALPAPVIRADRKTMPSPRLSMHVGAFAPRPPADLAWDDEEDETPSRPTARALAELVWRMDDADLDALSSHLERVVALRRLGPDAFAEARILDILASIAPDADEGASLSTLRAHAPELSRDALNRALLRLEARGLVALSPSDGVPTRDALHDPKRGLLGRCARLSG